MTSNAAVYYTCVDPDTVMVCCAAPWFIDLFGCLDTPGSSAECAPCLARFAEFSGRSSVGSTRWLAGTSTHGGSVESELKALQSLQFGAEYLAEDALVAWLNADPEPSAQSRIPTSSRMTGCFQNGSGGGKDGYVGVHGNPSRNLIPSAPHNDLHPAADDYTQKEGREESHCDLRVKHCHCPRETPVLRSRPRGLLSAGATVRGCFRPPFPRRRGPCLAASPWRCRRPFRPLLPAP
jgi:hypothetical protein